MSISPTLFKRLKKLVIIATVSVVPLVSVSIYAAEAKSKQNLEMLELFGDVLEKVRQDYVDDVSYQDLIESAINGMLTALDPHSGYLNKKAFDEMKVQTRGEFGGLGIEVTMENNLIKVVSPIDDTPAYRAGIQAGDYISHIDSESVSGLTLAQAVDKMRGAAGSKITVTVLREGATEPKDYVIVRDIIKIKSVRSKAEGDIAYLRITSFSEQTFGGLKKEFLDLQKSIGKDLKGIVLDLRNNPGGLLDQAIEVSDAFLNQGEIVSTRGRDPNNAKRVNAREGDISEGLPIVVLINGGSASASEIVAGALQDHHRAIVMGTRSFGKGSVQTVIPLPGDRAMRLTTSRYYTPSGRSIQAEGIEPDIVVEQAKVEPIKSNDLYKEANLPGHLTNGEATAKDKPADKEKTPNFPIAPSDSKDKKADELPVAQRDYQLARAIDLLHALAVFESTKPQPPVAKQ